MSRTKPTKLGPPNRTLHTRVRVGSIVNVDTFVRYRGIVRSVVGHYARVDGFDAIGRQIDTTVHVSLITH